MAATDHSSVRITFHTGVLTRERERERERNIRESSDPGGAFLRRVRQVQVKRSAGCNGRVPCLTPRARGFKSGVWGGRSGWARR